MPTLRREQKPVLWHDRHEIVWSGALLAREGQTKGELLPRYDRKQPALETTARLVPRKHRSAE
jgi:hypothetical protein